MNRKAWLSIRDNGGSLPRFLRSRGLMIHQSCAVAMLPAPNNPTGPRVIPWVERPGHTLNLGRNKAKRELRRGARKCWRVLPRGAA